MVKYGERRIKRKGEFTFAKEIGDRSDKDNRMRVSRWNEKSAKVSLFVKSSGNSTGLYGDEIATDAIDDGLKNGEILEAGYHEFEDETTAAADEHRDHNRRPAGIEHVVGIFVFLGDPDPERSYEDVAGDDEGSHPVLFVYRFVEDRRDPGQQGERRYVTEARGNRGRHVVRIYVTMTRKYNYTRCY